MKKVRTVLYLILFVIGSAAAIIISLRHAAIYQIVSVGFYLVAFTCVYETVSEKWQKRIHIILVRIAAPLCMVLSGIAFGAGSLESGVFLLILALIYFALTKVGREFYSLMGKAILRAKDYLHRRK